VKSFGKDFNKLTGSSETQIHQLVPERFAAAELFNLENNK